MAARRSKSAQRSKPPNTKPLGWLIDADLFDAFTTLCNQRKFTYRGACEAAFAVFLRMPKDTQRDAYHGPNDPAFVDSLDWAMREIELRRARLQEKAIESQDEDRQS